MKQRMVAAYNLQQKGILAKGQPIRIGVDIPQKGEPLCLRIDPAGNFVLFVEVWSHPEGTKVNFQEVEFLVVPTGIVISPGSWLWYETLSAGQQIFHVYKKNQRILQ